MKYAILLLSFFTFTFLSKAGEPVKAVNLKFETIEHDFGNMPQGKPVTYDFVFENTLQKIGYIDFFNGSSLKLFKCASDDIQLINIESVSKFETIQDFLKAMASDLTGFTLQRHAKKYHPNRAVELFRMISSGGLVSDGYWYEKMVKSIEL